MRGRKPKTAYERKLSGNAGKRPIPEEPTYTAGAPRMPAWLSRAAKSIWKRTIPELVKAGTITTVDEAVLASYCDSYAGMVDCRKALERTGGPTLVKTEKGKQTVYQNPAVFNLHKYREATLKAAALLGLTPVDRARVKLAGAATPGDADDPFAEDEAPTLTVHRGGKT